ncbi:MOSC domain-containing protein [Nocardia brasiliensis]|uniref:MOSC domain-containing protein n=1 Tax=Nocardia brasiliensis TaxID=37326 RepID=UPI0024581F1A|nr:MOSC N-terminal beta barrel domain-containing protein [Nocardia brasiliensis]
MVGQIAEIRRFPVKSTAGESLPGAAVDERGLHFDRRWAVYTADGGIASGKTTRRFRKVTGLMRWRSAVDVPSGLAYLWDCDDRRYRVGDPLADKALTEAFERPLVLRAESTIKHHDESGVHIVTTSSVRRVEQLVDTTFDPHRTRANLLVETDGIGFIEDGWSGAILSIGPTVVLRLGVAMPRCVMIDQPRTGASLSASVLKSLGREHSNTLGLKAEVVCRGTISVGDTVRLG